jgi:hypothetical protein
MNFKKYVSIGLSVCSIVTLSACSDNDSKDKVTPEIMTQSFDLTLSNLSSHQPLAPLAVAIHGESYSAWSIGVESSIGLEKLAEEGDVADFLTEATDAGAYTTKAGAGLIFPGESETLELESISSDDLKLTFASMFINTNDAFIGIKGLDLASLDIGDELTVLVPVYDAGTEANNELNGTIPGPADGGEGYNALRDDFNVVSRHPGVVTNEDGYANSILDSSHRFDAPAAKLVLKRTQ